MKLALFDFDHTLLDGDTNILWISHLVAQGLVGPDTIARQQHYMDLYSREQLDMAEYMDFHLQLLGTRTLSAWQPIVDHFIRTEIAPRIAPEGLQTLEMHRNAGHRLALVTATNSVLIGAVGKLLNIDTIASNVEVLDDRITGRTLGQPSFREHKIARVQDWLGCPLNAPSIEQSVFYSDSINDAPLLQAVSHPVAVNPDAKLLQLALAQTWPMQHWKAQQPLPA